MTNVINPFVATRKRTDSKDSQQSRIQVGTLLHTHRTGTEHRFTNPF